MAKRFHIICLLSLAVITVIKAEPNEKQVAIDAASFHQFRITVLANANEIDRKNPRSNAGAEYIYVECKKLAHRTSVDYLYGIVEDLIQDTSRTEEPYFIAIGVLDNYPPDEARSIIKKIIDDPKYKACGDVKNWLWEIDEAQKSRQKSFKD